MEPKTTAPDPLRKLDLFDPETAKMVRGDLQARRGTVSPEALSLLVEETIWGLSLEISFGQAVARGMLSLMRLAPDFLQQYRTAIRAAGSKGPTIGRLMALHLAPVMVAGQRRVRRLFIKAFGVMETAGVFTLTKPLEVLDQILHAGDFRSAETYLSLLITTFSKEMPYHRRQQYTVKLPKAALQYTPAKRPWQLQQVERVMRIDDRLASALLTGMHKGLDLLSADALSRFVSQGLERCKTGRQGVEAFFSLESRAGRSALDELQVAASLLQVQPHLNRYLRARTGREVAVRPLPTLLKCADDRSLDAGGTCSDGNTIYLPVEIDRFDTKTDNTAVYKCLTRFEAGLHEFGTFRFDLEKVLEMCGGNLHVFQLPDPNRISTVRSNADSDLERFFALFSEPRLAEDLFVTFEHGRILHLLMRSYPGLVSSCLPMFQREARILLSKYSQGQFLLPVYAAIACGLPLKELQQGRSVGIRLIRQTTNLFTAAMQQGLPAVETSGQLVAESYTGVENFLDRRAHGTAKGHYQRLKTPFQRRIRSEVLRLSGRRIEQLVHSVKKQLADKGLYIYASVLRDHLVASGGELRRRDMEKLLRRPENYTRQGRTGRVPSPENGIDIRSEALSLTDVAASGPSAVQHKECPSFWYREWDCRLGDYLSEHTRVMECMVDQRSSDFYESTLARHAGLVKRIRAAFELLKPQGLKWYRQWIEGDEFDYRQLLDFALDRRAGRTPTERLYIKRIKAQRDVAVLLLVDLSRSTANAVSGSIASVLDVEKEAIVLLSEALLVVGDRYAIDGFSGNGRLGVEYFRIKDFGESLDNVVRSRINAMSPRRNTRMGAAIRHAASRLSAVSARVKMLIMLGDGFPNDLNYKQSYAVEDTRRAIAELRAQGICVHAITVNMDPANTSRLDALYGDIHHNLITEVTDLPDRLWRIYGALTR